MRLVHVVKILFVVIVALLLASLTVSKS